jgi:orotidine-5'-phosphate decarboxylase
MEKKNLVIVALDVPSLEKAEKLVSSLSPLSLTFKVNSLFTRFGSAALEPIRRSESDFFLDTKFHDIPDTVERSVAAAAELGAAMVTIHASGGRAMIEAAARAAAAAGKKRPLILAVTILTSLDSASIDEIGFHGSTGENVIRLAKLAHDSGADGVIASGWEIQPIREACGNDFLIVCPGVRPAGSDKGDQARVVTPKRAIEDGANYIVVGRPIVAASDPRAATQAILKEIE